MPTNEQDSPSGTSRPTRSLVLVAGSGRSGTSLFSGILQRLGYAVAATRGAGGRDEPARLRRVAVGRGLPHPAAARAGVQVADARPGAWALTAEAGLEAGAAAELRAWLGARLGETPACWSRTRGCRGSCRCGALRPRARRGPAFVTMLRHPAAVIGSKQRWYRGWQGDVALAGWINQTVYIERATRGAQRSFVRYEDLLEDWTRAIGRAGEQLELAVRDASPGAAPRARVRRPRAAAARRRLGRARRSRRAARAGRELWELAPARPTADRRRRGRRAAGRARGAYASSTRRPRRSPNLRSPPAGERAARTGPPAARRPWAPAARRPRAGARSRRRSAVARSARASTAGLNRERDVTIREVTARQPRGRACGQHPGHGEDQRHRPVYNVEPFLDECLRSLAGQTFGDLEVVMVDDGSTDGSAAIAERFAARDGRFRLLAQPNAGLGRPATPGSPRARRPPCVPRQRRRCCRPTRTSGCWARSSGRARTSRPATCSG